MMRRVIEWFGGQFCGYAISVTFDNVVCVNVVLDVDALTKIIQNTIGVSRSESSWAGKWNKYLLTHQNMGPEIPFAHKIAIASWSTCPRAGTICIVSWRHREVIASVFCILQLKLQKNNEWFRSVNWLLTDNAKRQQYKQNLSQCVSFKSNGNRTKNSHLFDAWHTTDVRHHTKQQNLCVLSHTRAAASHHYALHFSRGFSFEFHQNKIDSIRNGMDFTWTLEQFGHFLPGIFTCHRFSIAFQCFVVEYWSFLHLQNQLLLVDDDKWARFTFYFWHFLSIKCNGMQSNVSRLIILSQSYLYRLIEFDECLGFCVLKKKRLYACDKSHFSVRNNTAIMFHSACKKWLLVLRHILCDTNCSHCPSRR